MLELKKTSVFRKHEKLLPPQGRAFPLKEGEISKKQFQSVFE